MSASVITTFLCCLMFVSVSQWKTSAVLLEITSRSLWFNSGWHFTARTQASPFSAVMVLGCCYIEATRGLKSCRADWEIGHVICPWNIMWHNMTPGHLYVKVNISAWQLDMSGQERKRADKAPVSVVLYLRLRKRCCGSAWLPSV